MITIDSAASMSDAVAQMGLLPFFKSPVPGLSVQEMCAPGCLFGDEDGDGAWEWKSQVISERQSAYGKLFCRKAGFVSIDLLPDFLNFRREYYPLHEDTPESDLLDIIKDYGTITSTELKQLMRDYGDPDNPKRKASIEPLLQRLQMMGRVIISDFKWKVSSRGENYGWGVAEYSTPEHQFGKESLCTSVEPIQSSLRLLRRMSEIMPFCDHKLLIKLIR